MKSETFFCPHCQVKLTKSAQAWVLGEMTANPQSRCIGFGEPVETVPCPKCGLGINTDMMIQGNYDRPKLRRCDMVSFLGFAWLAGIIGLKYFTDLGILGAVGVSTIGSGLLGFWAWLRCK